MNKKLPFLTLKVLLVLATQRKTMLDLTRIMKSRIKVSEISSNNDDCSLIFITKMIM